VKEKAVTRSYVEATAPRRARLTEAAKRQTEVFAGAYSMAVQLIELRERRGMTQAELATATGIDQGDISRVERGSANPTEKTLLRIADALGAELRFVDRAAS
jgi:ribosome-binding protein aMBF1 (putative translation factor)